MTSPFDELRKASEAPPPGARARVWAGLERADRRRRVFKWVAGPALAAACALALMLVRFGASLPHEDKVWQGPQFVVAAERAKVSWASPDELELVQGRLAVSTWGQRSLKVKAGRRHVTVESASVVITVAGEQVTVAPVDGAVLVDEERVEASEVSRAAAGPLAKRLVAREPQEASGTRALAAADRALEEGEPATAAAAFERAARLPGPTAELALFRKGETELRALAQPATARSTFDEGDRRFPSGSLAAERALSALEAAARLQDWSDVARRAEVFLRRYPSSERVREVRALRASALVSTGERVKACAELGGSDRLLWRERCAEGRR